MDSNTTTGGNKRSEHPTAEDGRDFPEDGAPEPPPAEPADPITSQVLSLTERDLQELSQADQEQVVYDLYGFSGPIDESAEGFVEQKMRDMQAALDQIPDRRKMAYRMALEIDSEFVNNHGFRLMFLRADRFDVTEAAERLVVHMENKLDLFGRELLCKEITQDDLDPHSLELLYKTWYVDVPVRDRAGRQVVIQCSKKGADCYTIPVEERMRVLFYTMCVAARDPETQLHGRVTLLWIAGSLGKASSVWKIAQLKAGAPLRHQGIHICVDSNYFHLTPMIAIAQMSFSSILRVRVRRHIGTPNEIKYALMTYGIPTDFIPIGEDGEFAYQMHCDRWERIRTQERWLKQQRQLPTMPQALPPQEVPPLQPEQAVPAATIVPPVQTNVAPMNQIQTTELSLKDTMTPLPVPNSPTALSKRTILSESRDQQVVVDTPTNQDVLMGKGRGSQEHAGNISFRKLIEKCRPQYDSASKAQKTQLAKDIIRVVREEWKGRFLREDVKGWIPIKDDLAIRRKVSVAFRDARKPAKGKKPPKEPQPAATKPVNEAEEEDLPPLDKTEQEDQPAIDMFMVAKTAEA